MMVQTRIVHLIRNSQDFVSCKDRKAVVAALKEIYRAIDADAARLALDDFADGIWAPTTRQSPCPGGGTGQR